MGDIIIYPYGGVDSVEWGDIIIYPSLRSHQIPRLAVSLPARTDPTVIVLQALQVLGLPPPQ